MPDVEPFLVLPADEPDPLPPILPRPSLTERIWRLRIMTHDELRERDLALSPIEEVNARVLGRPVATVALLRVIDAAMDARVARLSEHTSQPRDRDDAYRGAVVNVCQTAASLLASELEELARQSGGVGEREPASLSPETWERVRMAATVIQADRRQALYGTPLPPALIDIRSH
jgi:hypothetical protein